ncbi:hypothetical protein FHG87_004129 [Trinorchestia longiramus]|nr:hypothetical protein FHG87_004129 [Trinorchestia longiramus]
MKRKKDIHLKYRLAAAALLKEAVLGAARASVAGPSGWKKPSRCAPNKTFLTNTIRGAVSSNRIREAKLSHRSRRKKVELEESVKDNLKYKKQYLTASTKTPARCITSKSLNDATKLAEPTVQSTDEPNTAEERLKNTSGAPSESVHFNKSCVVWTDEESLELRPITEEQRNQQIKERSILRARRKLRSLNFVAAEHNII